MKKMKKKKKSGRNHAAVIASALIASFGFLLSDCVLPLRLKQKEKESWSPNLWSDLWLPPLLEHYYYYHCRIFAVCWVSSTFAAAAAAYQLMCIATNKLPRFRFRLSLVDKVRALLGTVVFTLAAAAKVVLNFGTFQIFFFDFCCFLMLFWRKGEIPLSFLCSEVLTF